MGKDRYLALEIGENDELKYGVIDLEELKASLREDTIFVSIMMVNNEIGALQPIAEAAKIIKDYNKEILGYANSRKKKRRRIFEIIRL